MKNFKNLEDLEKFETALKSEEEWSTLQDKTQVFNDRITDDVKSRGSHCGDVAEISRELCKLLGADDVECQRAYILGLIHDLGHIPYGHAGESVADSIIENHRFTEKELEEITEVRKLIFGESYVDKLNSKRKNSDYSKNICFEHNENSVLRYITLCKKYGYEVDKDIITGILAHSTSRYANLPQGLDQQAVRLADKLAYINYDVNDLFISFKGKEEFSALEKIYQEKFVDPNGNEIKITLPNGKSYTLYEFLTQVSIEDRINLFVEESVRDAKNKTSNPGPDYEGKGYKTILTGCNDTGVKLAGVRKKLDKKGLSPEEKAELEREREMLEMDLYTRSPILYAAYEIKNRSDEFIRSGKGLTHDLQVDRTTHALSAVGNPDLLNEYIYKSIATDLQDFLKHTNGMSIEQVRDYFSKTKIPKEFLDFYEEYINFKSIESSVLLSLDGNTEGLTYPEIYTILNYIGIHSNSELNELATAMNYRQKFEVEVVPQIEVLLNDDVLYSSEKGVLTKEGRGKRDKLVSEYGAKIKLDYGLEEENLVPTVKEETIQKMLEAGHDVGEKDVQSKDVTKEEFDVAKAKAEKEHIEKVQMQLANQQSINENVESAGRRI